MHLSILKKESLERTLLPKETQKVVIDQKNCQYIPRVTGIQAGQTIEILNSDNTLHNVHSAAKNSKNFNLGMPVKGMKITPNLYQPRDYGDLKVRCARLDERLCRCSNTPFLFDIWKRTVPFRFRNLPAGTYTVEACMKNLVLKHKR